MTVFLPVNEKELEIAVKLYRHMNNSRDPFYRINELKMYLNSWNIKRVVVGISGGVDSALVLAMLLAIRGIEIYAVTGTFDVFNHVYDQKYVDILRSKFSDSSIKWRQHDLSGTLCSFMDETDMRGNSPVFEGQVSYAMRYLMFFAYAQQHNAVTIGTTNFDEFGYAGWFGKTSDMMVDIQPIADLHKFEVQSWARLLGVPEEIIERKPTGDLVNASTDEENFGCTYDELSYFTDLMRKKVQLNEWMTKRFATLIALHEKNAHKYQQGQHFNPIFL